LLNTMQSSPWVQEEEKFGFHCKMGGILGRVTCTVTKTLC
jgi:hypothetical protein